MNKNFPELKKDIKAQDKKANGVLNRTDKKTKINSQTANSLTEEHKDRKNNFKDSRE